MRKQREEQFVKDFLLKLLKEKAKVEDRERPQAKSRSDAFQRTESSWMMRLSSASR